MRVCESETEMDRFARLIWCGVARGIRTSSGAWCAIVLLHLLQAKPEQRGKVYGRCTTAKVRQQNAVGEVHELVPQLVDRFHPHDFTYYLQQLSLDITPVSAKGHYQLLRGLIPVLCT